MKTITNKKFTGTFGDGCIQLRQGCVTKISKQ